MHIEVWYSRMLGVSLLISLVTVAVLLLSKFELLLESFKSNPLMTTAWVVMGAPFVALIVIGGCKIAFDAIAVTKEKLQQDHYGID